MNLQSFVATTLAATVGLAGIGAGALASFPHRPAAAVVQPAAIASAAQPSPVFERQAAGGPDPAPSRPAAAPRRLVAQAASRSHAAHPRMHPARAEAERPPPRAVRAVVRDAGPPDRPRQVVALPPGWYPSYAGYYSPY